MSTPASQDIGLLPKPIEKSFWTVIGLPDAFICVLAIRVRRVIAKPEKILFRLNQFPLEGPHCAVGLFKIGKHDHR
jgi:hypothetical protein